MMGLAILLMSNMWLLRENERTRSRLEQYRTELSALDDRIYRMLVEIDMRRHGTSFESFEDAYQELLGETDEKDEKPPP